MQLFGRDIDPAALLAELKERLRARGVVLRDGEEAPKEAEPTAPSDAFSGYLELLQRHVDCRAGLPIETHRAGLGRSVAWAKRIFRAGGRGLINELLDRQRLFNEAVRDSLALLFAEVKTLREELAHLRDGAPSRPPPREPG